MNDQPFSHTINKLVTFYSNNYELLANYSIVPGQREYLGSKNNRVCRFCEKDETKTKFSFDAHAIPELLGNKSLFTTYECDDCNHFFGSGIENDLGNWTKPSRTLSRIQGKRGVPSIKKHGKEQRWRIDYDNDGFHFQHYESDPHFFIDEQMRQVTFELTRDVFTPAAVLKAFVKIGLTLLPCEEVHNFKETLFWIRQPHQTKPYVTDFPIIHTFQTGPMRNDLIVAMILRRKEAIVNVPYAFLVLGFGNDVYQVFIPCPKRDIGNPGDRYTIVAFPTPGGTNPQKYGRARPRTIDLCGRQPVTGEKVPVVMSFDEIEIAI